MDLHKLRGIIADYRAEYEVSSVSATFLSHYLKQTELSEGERLEDMCLVVTIPEADEELPERFGGLRVFYEIGHTMLYKGK